MGAGSAALGALLVLLACAGPPRREARPSRRAVPRLPVAVTEAELGQARAMLEKARPELEARHWELLNQKLLAAEHARERYESSRPTGQPRAEPPSPAMGLAGGGAAAVGEGTSLAPLLVLLVALWPSETAGPGVDPPPWHGPYLDYQKSLRELSEAAVRVRSEIEASRGRRKKPAADVPPPMNCGEAIRNAKASVPRGEYPRHCSCSDTDGFRGAGTQCENHTR